MNAGPQQLEGSANPNWRGGYSSECTQCGNPVWVKPSRADRPRHFCSKTCCNSWMAKAFTGTAQLIAMTCVTCGKQRSIPSAEVSRNGTRFCSRKCAAAKRKQRTPKLCETCGGTFEPRNKKARFCSRPCKIKSQIKPRTPDWYIKKRLNARIGSLMWYTLKGNKAGVSWQSLVGYTMAELREHLESLFLPGMSWANMGEWHIDHIIPRKFFAFTTPSDEGFKHCWAISNLQPLWAVDNLRKGASMPAQE